MATGDEHYGEDEEIWIEDEEIQNEDEEIRSEDEEIWIEKRARVDENAVVDYLELDDGTRRRRKRKRTRETKGRDEESHLAIFPVKEDSSF